MDLAIHNEAPQAEKVLALRQQLEEMFNTLNQGNIFINQQMISPDMDLESKICMVENVLLRNNLLSFSGEIIFTENDLNEKFKRLVGGIFSLAGTELAPEYCKSVIKEIVLPIYSIHLNRLKP